MFFKTGDEKQVFFDGKLQICRNGATFYMQTVSTKTSQQGFGQTVNRPPTSTVFDMKPHLRGLRVSSYAIGILRLTNRELGGGNSNIFYFHPYLGKISNLTNICQMG